MDRDQIKHMVDRFLSWKLPENFSPDAGISFKPAFNEHTAHPMKHEPSGTNLLNATQAEAMVRYMLDGMPGAPSGEMTVAALREKVLDAATVARSKGFPGAVVTFTVEDYGKDRLRYSGFVLTMDDASKALNKTFGDRNFDKALDALVSTVAGLPQKPTAADVAATLGLPIYEVCDEAVATHRSHDPADIPGPYVEPTMLCEPCLEKAADQQAEHASEDAA